ncbi:MAG: hypothetical protein VYE42_06320, partial [Actinomycetota bacterium]|nr:hypothetical protein [Actinomycetota bacterium]
MSSDDDSIVDIAGNPLIEAVDNLQTVDTVNPSTLAGEPFVSDVVITDADAEAPPTLSVSFTFDEDMDVTRDPSVTFDPAVASTLIEGTPQGAWLGDGRTFKVDAVVADAGVDVDQVKIDITDAYDVAGNLQVDHTATVDLEIDTLNPTASTLSIVVDDNDQTDGDAVSSFTVSTTDVDPGMIHVDMRGSEHTELTSIKSSYIAGVNQAITDLEAAESTAAGLEAAVVTAQGDVDAFFGADGAGNGYADSAEIGSEASRVEGLGADFDSLEAAVVTAQGEVNAFFGTGGEGDGFADSTEIGDAAADAEAFAAGLPEDSEFAEDALLAASQLRELETDAQTVEGALADAQGNVDSFFVDGAGSEFADEADLQSIAGGLRSDESAAQALESDVLLLSDALDATDNLFETSPMFDSASFNAGIGAREIGNLADLNVQIGDSIVTRDIAAVDDTAHTVSLTQAEVDRLGEGSVQIEAKQTDAVGNLHEGALATSSFVID